MMNMTILIFCHLPQVGRDRWARRGCSREGRLRSDLDQASQIDLERCGPSGHALPPISVYYT